MIAPSQPTVRYLDRTTPPHISTLILLAGLSALSMNVFLPSLPAMAAYFEADYRLVQLSVTVYLATNALIQLFVGPISDRYGRRPVILAGIGVFLAASLGCVLAPSIEVFLAFRVLQAAIITGLVLSRAAIRDMVPDSEAASMIGYVTMGMSLVPMIGPAIGGVLEEWFGWHANFWMLLILGLATLWLVYRDFGETALNRPTSFRAQMRQYPELLTARRFWGYCMAAAFASGAFFAYLGGAPYVGTQVYGLSPASLGLFFGAAALGYMLGNGISGRLSVRLGINAMILGGTVISTAGLLASLLLDSLGIHSPWSFFGFMVFVGLGNGMCMPNATAGMLSVRPHLAGSASGLGGAIMLAGGAALSAFAAAILVPGSGAAPLIWTMLISSALSILSIVYVIRRERRIFPG
jgi:DHA1 family bicyclomycin/chloramphenicol resistance-like MFS transporter